MSSAPLVTVVFENAFFLIVDKPAGWLTIPGRTGEADERPCLIKHLNESRGIKLFCVHRLDSEVSGLVIFAKEADAHRNASAWFENRQVRKTYECFSEKEVGSAFSAKTLLTWKSRLLKGKKRAYEKPFGKDCVTNAEFLADKKIDGTLRGHWRLTPVTGRSHQLRFEMAKHGLPIWGDILYGSTSAFAEKAIALRAVELDFSQAVRKEAFDLPDRVAGAPLNAAQRTAVEKPT